MDNHLQTIRDYHILKTVIAPKLLRTYRGALSYRRAAEQLGCASSYLHKIEHGEQIMSDELLVNLIRLTKE